MPYGLILSLALRPVDKCKILALRMNFQLFVHMGQISCGTQEIKLIFLVCVSFRAVLHIVLYHTFNSFVFAIIDPQNPKGYFRPETWRD